MSSKNLYDHNYQVVDHLLRGCHLMLQVNAEFLPIAVYKNFEGKLVDFHDIDFSDLPSSEEIILRYRKALNLLLTKNEIASYALAYDVITTNYYSSEKTDAICIFISNINTDCSGIIYYSYKLTKGKVFEITGTWEEANV